MKKRIIAWMLAGSLLVLTAACGESVETKQQPEKVDPIKKEEVQNPEEEETEEFTEEILREESMEEIRLEEAPELFSKLKYEEFVFSSGAGAWATILRIDSDGNFSGSYHDSEMGDYADNYPNGTVYRCDFYGQFTVPVKVNDYTYSMQILQMSYEQEAGTEEVSEGFRYIYSDAHGLQDAEDILIYLPGAPLAELPEGFLNWFGYYDLSEMEETTLSYCALYNEQSQHGFYGYNMLERVRMDVLGAEETAVLMEASLENDPLTQTEMNLKAQELYLLWDSTLNGLWQTLKKVLDEDVMQQLTIEEREWIAEKELAVIAAGSEVEGGTMQPLVENLKAAELTKERVYELMELLEQS